MKLLQFFALLLVWAGFAGLRGKVYAQSNPRFQNPSLDSNCYFPQIGAPGEIDTIYGDSAYEGLGAYIHNLGPKPDGSFGDMLLGNNNGLGDLAPTGPNFNLHNLHTLSEALGSADAQYLQFGHFRDQSHLDLFDGHNWVIYWADDAGNYSGNRYTQLRPNIYGDQDCGGKCEGKDVISPAYIAHLSSDTIDDIVTGFSTDFRVQSKDSLYLALFKGGEKLFDSQIAYEDTSIVMPPPYANDYHYTIQGDFRGVGREDILISDYSKDLLYYKNDPPFTLSKLLNAMLYDTIWARSPINSGLASYESLAMRALPKKKGDNSVDWLVVLPAHYGIFIFGGGPDFGSHRITIDSAAFVLTPPVTLGESVWPQELINAGDMTGTGNDVLYVTASNDVGDYWYDNYYVTGQALDDEIDIYNSGPYSIHGGDSLTANSDSLEDFLSDRSWLNASGPSGAGALLLWYGSKQIPVHLNPAFVDVKTLPQVAEAGLSFFPNPATQGWSVATIVWPEAEIANYEVYNLLGEVVQTGTIRMLGGAEQERLYFPHLANGVYEVLIHSNMSDHPHEARAKLVLVR